MNDAIYLRGQSLKRALFLGVVFVSVIGFAHA
jgi:hypothetical protein